MRRTCRAIDADMSALIHPLYVDSSIVLGDLPDLQCYHGLGNFVSDPAADAVGNKKGETAGHQ